MHNIDNLKAELHDEVYDQARILFAQAELSGRSAEDECEELLSIVSSAILHAFVDAR